MSRINRGYIIRQTYSYTTKFPSRDQDYYYSNMTGGKEKELQICVESSTTHGVLEYSTRVCTRLNILIA